MTWQVQIYPSGTTIVTDEKIAMYCHSFERAVAGQKDDAALDRWRAEYAFYVRDMLNEAELQGMTIEKWRKANVNRL